MDKEYVNRLITTGLVDKAMSFGLNKHCIANSNIAIEIVVDNSNSWHTSKKSSLLNTIDLVKSRHVDDGESKCISDTVLYWLNDIEEKHKNNLLIDKETAETFFDSIEQLQFRVEAISYDIITQKLPLDIRVTKEMLLSAIESIKEKEESVALLISSDITNTIEKIYSLLTALNNATLTINSYIGSVLALMDMIDDSTSTSAINDFKYKQLLTLSDSIQSIVEKICVKNRQSDMTELLSERTDINTIANLEWFTTSKESLEYKMFEPFNTALSLRESMDTAKLSTVYDSMSYEHKMKLISIKLKLDMIVDMIAIEGSKLEKFISNPLDENE